ncbi:MAG: nucleotidyltransferase [Cyanothece sp. SIO1E1]|nr:nucleotidyltransferase [Cyanothece sp. SIO1E1]
MAISVNSAFDEFNKAPVNLDPEQTKKARSSRDWLIKQLEGFPLKIDDFPRLYKDRHIYFGSFARNTKIRPLDDIDLILTFSADGTQYRTIEYGKAYQLIVPETAPNLRKLCNNDGTLNSIKLVNKLVLSLSKVEHYKLAKIHRRQEAATLKLSSYDWNFDIVPAFYTDTGYYIIPDGAGQWKATDPRIDQKQVSDCNQNFNGKVLQTIRTLKYWNRRAKMPSIPSYLFENLVVNFFNSKEDVSDWIDMNLRDFWLYLRDAIYYQLDDPKGFQGDINTIPYDERISISQKARETYEKAYEAINFETNEKNHEKSINKWREIFGDEFPKYG